MTVALGLVALGMVTPFLLQRMNGHGPTPIVIAAHLAALVVVWIGILDIAVGAAGLSHRLVEFCNLALHDPPVDGDIRRVLMMTVVVAVMIGRAANLWWRTAHATRRTRRHLLTTATHSAHDVTFASLGSVACTVGLLRPRVFVDSTMFPALTSSQRYAVLAHERGHVRGYHGVIDLTARCLAAGLAPWPGARLSQREVRRHLEAIADDRAARCTSRRTVATAIVTAATMPPTPALGAAGWSSWRVDRMLGPLPRQHHALAAAAIILILLSVTALVQTIGHLLAGVHLVPMTFPAL